MSKINLLIAHGIAVAILLGVAIFFYLQLQGANNMAKILSSSAVSPVMTVGEIKNISNKNLTLNYNGVLTTVKIKDDARILSIAQGSPKEITFQDLKIGDYLNITLSIGSDYSLTGSQILITPKPGQ